MNAVFKTSPQPVSEIHHFLFGDLYDWAGKYRIINIEKRERLLAGRSVWYSNDEAIPNDLEDAFFALHQPNWDRLTREQFVSAISRCFSRIWQVHPFREGNTRTIVMMMTFFVEQHGYFMDQELLAASAGYVRDSFVMASLDQFSEYEHLERILLDAVQNTPIDYDIETLYKSNTPSSDRYSKYQKEPYKPQPHYKRET